ncbi:NAD(P)/FAD-dependent oxidoreductase [Micromonospora sp. KC213]|uniref:NAD(P)/FAD-dependent oxidoreductase n=1 Tax=Micromonospora sp. KC213 TaxID=2530378 RepID=UPI001051B59C|nr:NAD(P)/FAD-dependent oxidoreductase [Micromonospora sp. KC213]TDC43077.1 NAD(P)/FAD-dependent oxidoreductase [Micromonospora sp. KC213]
MEERHGTVVIGAGPAGLTAAYELLRHGAAVQVFESDQVVGGISRTVERDGWRFDIGGHRFFTKVPRVEAFWHEVLPDEEFLLRPRMSRIFYRGALYDYPLNAGNALRNLGIREAIRCMGSYARARLRPPRDQSHFEGWVSARFGWRLYSIFFKTYTEKVWGMPADQLQADWAAQRIKNLSLSKAVLNALLPRRNRKDVTSLIEEFQYPKYGPGMMWERCTDEVRRRGGEVTLGTWVTAVHREGGRAVAVTVDGAGGERRIPADHVISSMPISELVAAIRPAAPPEVLACAADLRYRDFLTVALVVPEEFSFPDNWIYVHDPAVQVGRIQNFGSWSPYLVKDGRTCLGLEYFVFEDDATWRTPDDNLVALATAELEKLGLVRPGCVEAGYVVRMPKAYPVYDERYQRNVDTIRDWLARELPNVHPVGRNGMHRYNNQDHSMMTAMLTAENIVHGAGHDVWSVNVEQDYHERSDGDRNDRRGTGRDAPVVPSRPLGRVTTETRPTGAGQSENRPTGAGSAETRPVRRPTGVN